jgi:Uma2 family endonuclease
MAIGSMLLTTEEFLAMPDDGVDRELIRGELRESRMTTRGRPHCRVTAKLTFLLHQWRARQSAPRGEIYVGEIRVRLRRDPDTVVGIDLAYVSAAAEQAMENNASFVEGPPTLVIEVISPSDTAEGMSEKIREYQSAGVPLIWYVDPFVRTVTAYRLDGRHVLFNTHQDLTAEPELPGFCVPVAQIFED